jgi:hypothetical protein
MRSAPQSRLSFASRRIRSTVSGETRGGRGVGRPGLRSPKEPEALPVPTEDRVWFHDEKGISPPRDKTGENHEKPPLIRGEPRLLDGPSRDDELLAQECVLGDELLPRADHVPEQPTDHRGGPRSGPPGRLHALRRSARDTVDPPNQGPEHDPDLHGLGVSFKS